MGNARPGLFLSHVGQHLIWKQCAINVPRSTRAAALQARVREREREKVGGREREARIYTISVFLLRLFSQGRRRAPIRPVADHRGGGATPVTVTLTDVRPTFPIILNSRKSTRRCAPDAGAFSGSRLPRSVSACKSAQCLSHSTEPALRFVRRAFRGSVRSGETRGNDRSGRLRFFPFSEIRYAPQFASLCESFENDGETLANSRRGRTLSLIICHGKTRIQFSEGDWILTA